MGSSHTFSSYVRSCLILVCLLVIAGCSSLKSGLITGAATSAVVGVTSVLPGGVIVPAVAGGLTAATASALSAGKSVKGEPISVTAETVVNKSPDNIWTMLGKVTEFGGIGLLLFIGATYLLPLILGYLIPNGFERKKKKRV